MNVCVAGENSFVKPPDSWQLCHLDEDLLGVESCRSQPSFIYTDLNQTRPAYYRLLGSSPVLGPAQQSPGIVRKMFADI